MCLYIWTYTHVFACVYMYICKNICMHSRCACYCVLSHPYAYVYIRVYVHVYVHGHVQDRVSCISVEFRKVSGGTETNNCVFQSQCDVQEGVDEDHEFARLKQSMEMVGFYPETQRK